MALAVVFVATFIDLKIISLWPCDIVVVEDRSVANVQQCYVLREKEFSQKSICGDIFKFVEVSVCPFFDL